MFCRYKKKRYSTPAANYVKKKGTVLVGAK